GLRGAGHHRHVEQDFHFLDVYFLQDPAAGRIAELRRGRRRQHGADRSRAALELELLSRAAVFPPLRRGHRQSLSAAAGRARRRRPDLSLVVSRFLFHCRQAPAFSAALWAALLRYFQPPSRAALEQVSLNNFYGLPWKLLLQGAWNTVILMMTVPTI